MDKICNLLLSLFYLKDRKMHPQIFIIGILRVFFPKIISSAFKSGFFI